MNWDRYWLTLLYNLGVVLPWILGGLVTIGAFTLSPLGRGLLRHLSARREEEALLEELLTQVTAMRTELADVTERLDGTDRLLRAVQPSPLAIREAARSQEPSAPSTPH